MVKKKIKVGVFEEVMIMVKKTFVKLGMTIEAWI